MGILGIDLLNPLQWDMASPDPKNKQDASVHYVLGVRGNIQAYLKNKIKNNGFNPITKIWVLQNSTIKFLHSKALTFDCKEWDRWSWEWQAYI